MSHKISRRQFLQSMGIGACAVYSNMLSPSFLMANTTGHGKNLIVVNLLGGVDGLSMCPLYEGTAANVINSQLRPTLGVSASSVVPFTGSQNGLPYKIGYHPSLSSLVNVAGSNMSIVQGYGIPGDPGRSHDTCQILMSLGATSLAGNTDMVGFLAKTMDQKDWDTFQYWAFGSENLSDVNTRKKSPVVIDNLDTFRYPSIEDAIDESAFAEEIDRTLLEINSSSNSLEGAYGAGLNTMFDTLATVKNDISSQVVGNNPAGNYSNTYFGQRVKDLARVLKAKATSTSFGQKSKDSLFMTAQGGYDTHSDQINPNFPRNLAALLKELSDNLAVLYSDLSLFGILDQTVIVIYSEFGRTNYENTRAGNPIVGTDHGHGSNTIVLGGPIQANIFGTAPAEADLTDYDYNALKPAIDYRDIFSETLNWLGINSAEIFNDPNYQYQRLGLI